jgi:hypothetical protein
MADGRVLTVFRAGTASGLSEDEESTPAASGWGRVEVAAERRDWPARLACVIRTPFGLATYPLKLDVERARATKLHAATTWEGALQTAHRIASSAKAAAGDLSDGSFWFANGEKLLAPLLLAASRACGTMETVVTWIDEGPEACARTVLPILDTSEESSAARAFQATHNREERARSSVNTTTETMLAAYGDPRVAEETAGSDYTPERLLDGGANTLFLISPRSEQARLRVVQATLIEELIARWCSMHHHIHSFTLRTSARPSC